MTGAPLCRRVFKACESHMRVLVVEDEHKIADALRDGLQAERHDVVVEGTGEGACQRTESESFDLILLDLGLPGRDGMDVLTALRQRSVRVPVIVLTARDTLPDRVAGLDAGADDYLVKPFAFAELLARMRALLRRGPIHEMAQLSAGGLVMDLLTHRVSRDGQPVDLTVKEFELLEYLLRYQGQVVSRETLAREVWKEIARTTPLDNIIDVHMVHLRRKLEVDGAPRLLHTIRGVGFVLRDGEP